ncbi:MAG: signal peptidase II [Bacilli bacterium]|nr:signal peptidase II [Bacilli bacterium]MDD4547954.1 signal peptidase II [Bacilli bacterium]
MNKKIIIISFICLIIDQLVKFVITTNIALLESISVIKSFFSITYVRNYGAAWSILEGNKIFLIMAAFLSLFLIYFVFIRNNKLNKLEVITYGVLIGGIFGNLVDRIIHGYVIDFFDFNIFGYEFPVFNMADIFIVISVGLMILNILKEESETWKNI